MEINHAMRRFHLSVPLLLIMPLLAGLICIGIGRLNVPVGDALRIIRHMIFGGEIDIAPAAYSVVANIRLPRILLAIFAGSALTAAGCAFQAVFSNPLAAPDTLGVSAGSGFGACVGLLIGGSSLLVQGFSFLGGILAVGLTFLLGKSKSGATALSLVLGGMAIAAIFQAGTSITQLMADPNQTLPAITYWLMGSLSRANFQGIGFALPAFISGLAVLLILRWRLNTLSLHEHEAVSLGIPVKMLRAMVIVAATLCTAATISLCGMVGWLGILAPHIARLIFGNDNRYVLPAGMSIGATSLIIMDTLARNLVTGELPISVLTALVGAPIFLLLLSRQGGNGHVI